MLKARQKAGGKLGRVSRGSTPVPSGSEAEGSEYVYRLDWRMEYCKLTISPQPRTEASARRVAKAATKWGDSKVTAADMAAYDYSSDSPSTNGAKSPPDSPINTKSLISTSALGSRTNSGLYEVADYDVGGNDSDSDDDDLPVTSSKPAGQSLFSSLMSKLSLSPRNLTAEDLAPALAAMREHLMTKNVAKDIADKVCDGVGKSLEGRKLSSFGSVKKEVKSALESSLVKILTPKSSTDLLLDINRKKASFVKPVAVSCGKNQHATPYTITFVGVNGVGKSTNLSKVAFWLLQNKLRVLIAACDTFRSGAVEQLRVHVRNLGKLGEESGGIGIEFGGVQMVELYERGYGKDASGIAKDAIAYGTFYSPADVYLRSLTLHFVSSREGKGFRCGSH